MYKGKTICLVLPCIDEAEGLSEILPEVPKVVDTVLIVDGGSTDGTIDIAKKNGAVVVTEKRPGYGRAHKTGVETSKADIIVTADGDGTYPIAQIPELVQYMVDNKIDFLSACRFPLRQPDAMFHLNYLGNVFLSTLASFLFHIKVNDIASGMWVFKRDIVKQMVLTSDRWKYSEEIKIEATTNPNISFIEYPIFFFPRLGTLKMNRPWKEGVRAVFFFIYKRFALIGRKY